MQDNGPPIKWSPPDSSEVDLGSPSWRTIAVIVTFFLGVIVAFSVFPDQTIGPIVDFWLLTRN